MFSGAVSAFIQAPPEAVFAYIADIGRHGEWGAQRQDVAPAPGGSHDASFAASIHIGPLALPSEIRVIERQAPARFVYECLDWSGHYRWTMLLQPEGSGARLTHRVDRRGNLFLVAGVHTYAKKGAYKITLTIQDGGGSSVTTTRTIVAK